jgi:hypothetical protein
VSYPIPSLSDSLSLSPIKTANDLGAMVLFFSPFVAGLVFGVVAALAARDQSKTHLAYGALVASSLYVRYLFIEGVPLIFPVLPFVVAIFLGGVYLSEIGVNACLPTVN